MKKQIALIAILIFISSFAFAEQQERERLDKIEQALKGDVPNILCVDEKFATAGQPADAAFGKLAANGYRSVLNLRSANEGVDLERERELVEKAGMRYISIPVVSSAPKAEQAEAFIKAVSEANNHPMLIHCASANRVGAFFMIYRVLVQGWPEDKALEEATRIGLKSPVLKQFAQDYIASQKQGKK
ncbi:MAG TPA: protein tyrosine phosphatase family protein [Blastocatellia bacterium]|nr:protein tyrosine phosphatase family protein [Blastocatellia bacterium]